MTDWPFGDLQPFCADLLLIDPPWQFKIRSAKGGKKSPSAHYECQSAEWIRALPVDRLAGRDCWLLLWTCAPSLDQAFATMAAWGFTYVSRISWRKVTVNGRPRMGPGYIARTLHEDILIGRIGTPTREKPFPSLFDGVAREHSRKPEELFPLIEAFAPQARKVELFARESGRPGWLAWGNEVEKFNEGVGNAGEEQRRGRRVQRQAPLQVAGGSQGGAERGHRQGRKAAGARGEAVLL